ncbi:MAG: polysaccharide deacetylase family protein [Christensenellales bacterium]
MAFERIKKLGKRANEAGVELGQRMGVLRLTVLALALVLFSGALLLRGVVAQQAFASRQAEPYRTGDSSQGKIAITCNVAWGEEFLPEMLDILKEKNVLITFVILGEWAETHREELKTIALARHELGNHGYYHVNHSQISADRVKQEITRTANLIKEITGITPTIFSPPSGDCDKESVNAAIDAGQKVILWSVDTIDWRRDGKSNILKRVFRDPKAGDIILMHPTKDTVEALPEIIDGLVERGLKPCPVGEILP